MQVDDGLEDPALETLACELCEEAFNGVKPVDENGKLKKLVAELSLDREMLQDVIRRKL